MPGAGTGGTVHGDANALADVDAFDSLPDGGAVFGGSFEAIIRSVVRGYSDFVGRVSPSGELLSRSRVAADFKLSPESARKWLALDPAPG